MKKGKKYHGAKITVYSISKSNKKDCQFFLNFIVPFLVYLKYTSTKCFVNYDDITFRICEKDQDGGVKRTSKLCFYYKHMSKISLDSAYIR